jgi:dihydrodipicolinate synthase/N-acetylneuraminate lyase
MLGVLKKAYVRPPLTPISEAERKVVKNALKESGLI